jgi:meiotic recombination protein SPO11
VSQTAAAKGLVAGSFRITRHDGYHIDGMNDKEVSARHAGNGPIPNVTKGMLVPKIGEHDTLDLMSVRWVLVIEKEVRLGFDSPDV